MLTREKAFSAVRACMCACAPEMATHTNSFEFVLLPSKVCYDFLFSYFSTHFICY